MLVVVLVVITLLSLSAYAFTTSMRLEARAVETQLRTTQARLAAESGVELARALMMLQRRGLRVPDLTDSPELFHDIALFDARDEIHPRLHARFSIVAETHLRDGQSTVVATRFGLSDENAKLDVGFWAGRDPARLRQVLESMLALPPDVAEAIVRRARSEPPYPAQNGLMPLVRVNAATPLDTLDQLLDVAGLTPQILYGDGAHAEPTKRAPYAGTSAAVPFAGPLPSRVSPPGVPATPLTESLTLYARASNVDRFGQSRIWLNDPDLTRLYRQVLREFGEPLARFVVAYRVFGPGAGATAPAEGPSGNPERGRYLFGSVTDLVGGQVHGTWKGKPVQVASPVANDSSVLTERLPRMLDRLSVQSDSVRPAAINLFTASDAALAMLPLSAAQRSAIRVRGMTGALLGDAESERRGLAALVTEAILSLDDYRAIEPFVTDRSEVFRLRSFGYYGERGPWVEIEAIIDGSRQVPDRVFYKERVQSPQRSIRDGITPDRRPHTLPDFKENSA